MNKLETNFALFAMVTCTVLANISFKVAASRADFLSGSLSRFFILPIFIGITFFGLAAVIYALILTRIPLHVAQTYASIQFVAVVITSSVVFGETIEPIQWVGVLLVALGVIVMGYTA